MWYRQPIAYAAPEVLLGRGPGPATDQYSLAITYYELRTGTLPFDSGRISDVIDAKSNMATSTCLDCPQTSAK